MIQAISSFLSTIISSVIHFAVTAVWPVILSLFMLITHTVIGLIASFGLIGILVYGIYVILDDQ